MFDKRTAWKKYGDTLRAWIGNGLYAVIEPVKQGRFDIDKRKFKTTYRYSVQTSQGCIVRGGTIGDQAYTMDDAKERAMGEAKYVGQALVAIAGEHEAKRNELRTVVKKMGRNLGKLAVLGKPSRFS